MKKVLTMKTLALLKNQKIQIDQHRWGSGIPNNWDNPYADIHIDKRLKNNKDEYKIKIPLNSNRAVTVNRKDGMNIPNKIIKEIQSVLEDENQRSMFTKHIQKIVASYHSDKLSNEQKARQAIDCVRKAFGLPTAMYVVKNEIKDFYAELYYLNQHYYYVVVKRNIISCSLNEGVWKRFIINEDSVIYRYDKECRCFIVKE